MLAASPLNAEIRQGQARWDGTSNLEPASLQFCGDARFFCREASGDQLQSANHRWDEDLPEQLLQPNRSRSHGRGRSEAGVTDDELQPLLQGVRGRRFGFAFPRSTTPDPQPREMEMKAACPIFGDTGARARELTIAEQAVGQCGRARPGACNRPP